MKTLVMYFSETGTTKRRAQTIATSLGVDIYEIKAKIPYTSQDRNWQDDVSRCNQEQSDENCRPEILGELPDISDYDCILVGHPTWWGIPPRIVQTVLDQLDFSDKILGSFSTSGGSSYVQAQPIFNSYAAKKHIRGDVLNSDSAMKRWILNIQE